MYGSRFASVKSMRLLAVIMALMIMLSGFTVAGFASGESTVQNGKEIERIDIDSAS